VVVIMELKSMIGWNKNFRATISHSLRTLRFQKMTAPEHVDGRWLCFPQARGKHFKMCLWTVPQREGNKVFLFPSPSFFLITCEALNIIEWFCL